jgi:hypothetical protein
MHNNFSKDYVNEDRFPMWRPVNSRMSEAHHVINDKYIPLTWENDNKIQFEDRPYTKYLFDMIDFDKFWFYKEEGVTKYGGQVEWSIKKYDESEISDDDNIPNIIWLECRGEWDNGKRSKKELIEFLEKTVYWQHTSPYLNRKFVKEELKSFLDEK